MEIAHTIELGYYRAWWRGGVVPCGVWRDKLELALAEVFVTTVPLPATL